MRLMTCDLSMALCPAMSNWLAPQLFLRTTEIEIGNPQFHIEFELSLCHDFEHLVGKLG